jgi:hypothetical protein
MATIQKIIPCLWFDDNAEAAVNHYISIFDNSRFVGVTRYDKGRRKPEGTILTIVFELAGQKFMALNGGPEFKFTEAISMSVSCDTQARDRSLLRPALRRRRPDPVRVAQRQVRPLLADRAGRITRHAARWNAGAGEPGHDGAARHGEAGPRRPATGL